MFDKAEGRETKQGAFRSSTLATSEDDRSGTTCPPHYLQSLLSKIHRVASLSTAPLNRHVVSQAWSGADTVAVLSTAAADLEHGVLRARQRKAQTLASTAVAPLLPVLRPLPV